MDPPVFKRLAAEDEPLVGVGGAGEWSPKSEVEPHLFFELAERARLDMLLESGRG